MDSFVWNALIILCTFLSAIPSFMAHSGNLRHAIPSVSDSVQEIAANDVLRRLLPTRYEEFELRVNLTSPKFSTNQDSFEIQFDQKSHKIVIIGTTGVTALFGLNYYLKYFCEAQVAWEGVQLDLPRPLPAIAKRLRIPLLDRFRYYQNPCTESYSFVWWDWDSWEREIDWMALNGINLPLAFTGQEVIWLRVFEKLGLSHEDIKSYIAGPAFLAWWRMGNLQKWAGPLPEKFLDGKFDLLEQILERMRQLGMIPVLPGFCGNIPPSLLEFYPNISYSKHPAWNSFNSPYSETYMLEPADPLFSTIAKLFIDEITDSIGTNHIYSCDAFNENRPTSGDSEYLRNVSQLTYESMRNADPKAIWMIQAWIFVDFDFWNKERVQSFLGGVEVGNLLVLDLQAESLPFYVAFDSFFNHTFIWCMLHNFGATMNLYGNLGMINTMLSSARKIAVAGSMVGIGLTPEGINQNYVAYDFMTEMTFYKKPIDLKQWFIQYANRRYGRKSQLLQLTWETLARGVYNNLIPGFRSHSHTVLTDRPRLNYSETFWYNPEDVSTALGYFLAEGLTLNSTVLKSELYLHDVVDFTRQFLIHLGSFLYSELNSAYNTKNIQKVWIHSAEILRAFDDLETILATHDKFLVGGWTKAAEKWGSNPEERELLKFNALAQITIWGPNGEILDYASKQWAGIASNYLKPRWMIFLDELESSLLTETSFNKSSVDSRILNSVEIPFSSTPQHLISKPIGNSFQEALRIYKTWRQRYILLVRGRVVIDSRQILKSSRPWSVKEVVENFGTTEQLKRIISGFKFQNIPQ